MHGHEHRHAEEVVVDAVLAVGSLVTAVVLLLRVVDELVVNAVVQLPIVVELVLAVNLAAATREV